MASKKHAKNKAESAVPYIRRVLEDEYVQEQLRSAASGLRAVYQRASKQGGQAAEDKRVLRQPAPSRDLGLQGNHCAPAAQAPTEARRPKDRDHGAGRRRRCA